MDVSYAARDTALLVIDPYNDFMSEGGKLYDLTRETAATSGFYENLPRVIDAATPRRVAIVGSFHWVMKQENLRRFVQAADAVFAQNDIQLDVIGGVPDRLREELAANARATRFHGFVDDPADHLAQARMAVVPEVIGGGFKLKFLDYLFTRVPIATLADVLTSASVNSRPAISGMPSVLKKPGPTLLKFECVSVSGPESNPCTRTLVPQLLPPSSGTIDAATLVTCGTDASSCSRRLKNVAARSVS